jgi:hypothetical protein
VILLNSNARSHFALTNAIGVVGPSQLKALRLILQNSWHPWLILLHHQIVEYPLVSISLRERIGSGIDQCAGSGSGPGTAFPACYRASRPSPRDWIGVCGNIVLCSAPSLGTDSVDKYRGSFRIHQLLAKAGGLQLIATERVRVS